MKAIAAILFSFFVHASKGQPADVTSDSSLVVVSTSPNTFNQSLREKDGNFSFQRSVPKRFVSKGNVVFGPTGLVLSPIESEILNRESLECKAMIDRDQESLKNIWYRDFSIDELTSELMSTQSGLPFYASLYRIIEKMYLSGELFFTSGVEEVRMLKSNGNLDKEFKREFFHTWARNNGVWKISIKSYTLVD